MVGAMGGGMVACGPVPLLPSGMVYRLRAREGRPLPTLEHAGFEDAMQQRDERRIGR